MYWPCFPIVTDRTLGPDSIWIDDGLCSGVLMMVVWAIAMVDNWIPPAVIVGIRI